MRPLAALVAPFAVLSLLAGAPAVAQETTPQIEAWPLPRIIAMGQEIQDQDVAAWVATDALVAFLAGAEPTGLAGWIVVPNGEDRVVRFVRNIDGRITTGWDVPVHDGVAGAVKVVEAGELTAVEQAMFRARQTASANIGPLRCSRTLNSVVTKDPDGDGWLVWLLTSTTQAGVVPMGGHYRFRISPDGSSVVRRDQLSTGCMALTLRAPDGSPTAAIGASTLVSDRPNETHVFLSLQNRIPIYVVSGETTFRVDGARIITVGTED